MSERPRSSARPSQRIGSTDPAHRFRTINAPDQHTRVHAERSESSSCDPLYALITER